MLQDCHISDSIYWLDPPKMTSHDCATREPLRALLMAHVRGPHVGGGHSHLSHPDARALSAVLIAGPQGHLPAAPAVRRAASCWA